MNSDTRLYASAIALVSGIYSIGSALGDGMRMMPVSFWVMLLIGLVVIVHGLVLLTPLGPRLGRLSGPLMLVWAVVMLANQLFAATSDSMMPSWDAGMVAVAVLMLASGVIMTRNPRSMER